MHIVMIQMRYCSWNRPHQTTSKQTEQRLVLHEWAERALSRGLVDTSLWVVAGRILVGRHYLETLTQVRVYAKAAWARANEMG